jgi:hypothetical protein
MLQAGGEVIYGLLVKPAFDRLFGRALRMPVLIA